MATSRSPDQRVQFGGQRGAVGDDPFALFTRRSDPEPTFVEADVTGAGTGLAGAILSAGPSPDGAVAPADLVPAILDAIRTMSLHRADGVEVAGKILDSKRPVPRTAATERLVSIAFDTMVAFSAGALASVLRRWVESVVADGARALGGETSVRPALQAMEPFVDGLRDASKVVTRQVEGTIGTELKKAGREEGDPRLAGLDARGAYIERQRNAIEETHENAAQYVVLHGDALRAMPGLTNAALHVLEGLVREKEIVAEVADRVVFSWLDIVAQTTMMAPLPEAQREQFVRDGRIPDGPQLDEPGLAYWNGSPLRDSAWGLENWEGMLDVGVLANVTEGSVVLELGGMQLQDSSGAAARLRERRLPLSAVPMFRRIHVYPRYGAPPAFIVTPAGEIQVTPEPGSYWLAEIALARPRTSFSPDDERRLDEHVRGGAERVWTWAQQANTEQIPRTR